MRAAEAIPSEQMRHWAQCEGREKQYWNHPRFGCLPSSYHDRGQTLHATHKNGLSKGTHKNGEEYKNEAMLNVIGKALADIQSYFGGSAATWYAESRPTDKKARSNKKPWEAVLAGVFEVRLKRQPKDHYVFYERVLNDIGAFEAGADLAEYYGVRKAAQGSSSLGTYTKPGVASSEWAKKMPTWITKAKEVGSIALCTDGGAENEAHLAFTYLQAAHEAHPDTPGRHRQPRVPRSPCRQRRARTSSLHGLVESAGEGSRLPRGLEDHGERVSRHGSLRRKHVREGARHCREACALMVLWQ